MVFLKKLLCFIAPTIALLGIALATVLCNHNKPCDANDCRTADRVNAVHETATSCKQPDGTPLPEDAVYLGDFTICYYCTAPLEPGDSYGMTSSGRPMSPYWSIAVDSRIIPLNTKVAIDFGNGDIRYYQADDICGDTRGEHLEIAVSATDKSLERTKADYGKVYVLSNQ